MHKNILLGLVSLALVVMNSMQIYGVTSTPAQAAPEQQSTHADSKAVKQKLNKFGKVNNLTYDADKGLFRASVSGNIVYITADGQYLLSGNLFDLDTRENLTKDIQAKQRVETLAQLHENDDIVFKPEGKTKATIWVLTDVTCPYCQKFHSQIDEYLAHGIEVHYLAFPRGGPNSQTWRLATSVWCADDRHKALTQAKQNPDSVPTRQCNDAHIMEQYKAGRKMGLRGTPMIVTAEGRYLGGYLPPDTLAKRLHLDG